jgi:MIP family channel proteins
LLRLACFAGAERNLQGFAMDKNLRPFLAELIGTFALVFLGAGTVIASQLSINAGKPETYLVSIALVEGIALAVGVTATMNVSGGFLNPAITLMLWVFKRLDGTRACWLIAAQLLGSVVAGLCLRLMFADSVLQSEAHFGAPHLNTQAFGRGDGITISALLSGIGIEVVLTFFLTFAIFGAVLDPRAPHLGGLVVGLALCAAGFMGHGLTGAATNPARWFGPTLWELTITRDAFRDHAVYWIGPILGALLGGTVYTYVLLPAQELKNERSGHGS